ncbi:Serine/threonine-protein kinase K06H7.1 [Aphelenchoides avenae]|nr:Serine/threonine-protein kinase K06H7.1 [Aphelenchus avenae]
MSSKGKQTNKPSESSNAAGKMDIGFEEGYVVSSMKTLYTVEKLLGEGGFGPVYRVKDQKDNKLYAMKVEKLRKDPRKSKLKMEVQILVKVLKERVENSHFTEIIDKGKKPKYCFLVMTAHTK